MQIQQMEESIFVIAELQSDRNYFNRILQDFCEVLQVNYSVEALEMVYANAEAISLILLDMKSNDSTGQEILRLLKANEKTRGVTVIALLDPERPEILEKYLEDGIEDFIIRPFRDKLIQHRICCQMTLKRSQEDWARITEAEKRKTVVFSENLLDGLATLMESRNIKETLHATRMRYYVDALLMYMQEIGIYVNELLGDARELITKAVSLHDIGKVVIPDGILLKVGRLLPGELQIIKEHTTVGADFMEHFLNDIDHSFINYCIDICRSHHERWDGTGYPDNLAGDNIPFAARAVAIADTYDALINKRVYKEAVSHEKALRIIQEMSGIHFDPTMVNAFFRIQKRFQYIAEKWKDPQYDE